LTQTKFDKQREVVRSELREKVENQPYGRVGQMRLQHAFPGEHPYAHDVLGSHEDLLAASLDDVRAFYRDYYTADNLSFVLAGDFDPAQAKQWIAKYFGSLPPGPSGLPSPVHSAPQLTAPKLVELRARVPEEAIFFAWPSAGIYQPDDAALEIAAFVLTDGWSHLNSALKEHACLGVGTYQERMQDASLFDVNVEPAPGTTVAEVEKIMAAEIARFAREGPSAEELTRARDNLEFAQIAKLEDLEDLAEAINQVQQFYGGVEHIDEWANRYRRVTAEGVRSAVGHWLATPNRLAVHVTPEPARPDAAPEPDRNQPPPFQVEKPYRAPEVKAAKLANGLQIFVVERHQLPNVAVNLRFRLGVERNPAGKAGLAVLTIAAAQRGGTADRSGGDIEHEFTRLATSLQASGDATSQFAGFEVLRRNLDPAVGLLAEVIRHPGFREDALEDEKKEFLEQLEKADGGIDKFESALFAIAFGANHPVGNMAGSAESRRSIARQDVLDFQRRLWKPDVAALTFAGDITLQEAVAIGTKSFGDWEGTAAPAPRIPPPAPMSGRLFLVDRKGATQTNVVQVLPGIPRDHPDYPALLLVNLVWGGMFSSRLVQNLRQQKGITYYLEAQMFQTPGYGLWFARSKVEAGRTRDAIVELMKELRGIAGEKPITALELETAKENFIRSYPSAFELTRGVAERVSMDWAWGLPVTDIQALPQRVSEVTLDRANAIARKYALVDRAFFLLIGDRQKIEPGLRDLGMGPVKLMP
jgi:zinc protease